MARERWVVDGYEFTEGLVRDVEYRAGLLATAPLVGDNSSIPNRSGVVWRPKRRGPASFTLNMWLGTEAGRDVVDRLYDDLIRAVGDGSTLPLWNRYLADGTVRECRGEVVGSLQPQPLGNVAMRLGVEVLVPSGAWQGTVDSETLMQPGAPPGSLVDLPDFGYVTAPMERLRYTIRGPATDVVVTDVTRGVDGDWFKVTGTVPAGTTLTLNAANWNISGSLRGGPNGLDLATQAEMRSAVSYSGSRFLAVRTPRPDESPRLRFEYRNGSGSTQLTIAGRPAFAV